MNLTELYLSLPVTQHDNIRVEGNRVLVKDTQGDIAEYILQGNGELWLIKDRELLLLRNALTRIIADLTKIKTKLGIT